MKRLLTLALITIAALLPSCARNSNSSLAPTPQGGEDGGGGSVHKSSVEEVRAAINLAWSLAREEGRQNLFIKAGRSNGFTFRMVMPKAPEERAAYLKAMDKIFGPAPSRDSSAVNTDHIPIYDMLSSSTLEVLELGPCPSPNSDHADASVTSRSRGAKFCFSIENLRRVGPFSLDREIIGLMLHEIVHIYGLSEAEANWFQTNMVGYVAAILEDRKTRRAELSKKMYKVASQACEVFIDARSRQTYNPKHATAATWHFLDVTEFDWEQTLGPSLQYRLNPLRPEVYQTLAEQRSDLRQLLEPMRDNDTPDLAVTDSVKQHLAAIVSKTLLLNHNTSIFLQGFVTKGKRLLTIDEVLAASDTDIRTACVGTQML